MLMDALSPEELARYSRHIILPQIGKEGQERLKRTSVLVIGMGGLGSPVSLYLAAAGIGKLGLVDDDRVEAHNLQRQVLHDSTGIDSPKTVSAVRKLTALNPNTELVEHRVAIDAGNAKELMKDYDVVVDGSDNFPTRYLVNDACVLMGKPLVYGSIFQFEGQVSFFHPAKGGPCYRCLFPELPPPGSVPNCEEAGVFGALCGVVGSFQAMETIKYLTGAGESLSGRLMVIDALTANVRSLRLKRDPACPVCGESPRIKTLDANAYAWSCEPEMLNLMSDCPLEISVKQAAEWLRQEPRPVLLDVREPHEVAICQINGSIHIPLGELGQRYENLPRDATIIIYCHHGGRSLRAAKFLREKGFENATNMKGSIDAWSKEIDPSIPRY